MTGVYGLRLAGLADASNLMTRAWDTDPTLRVDRTWDDSEPVLRVDEERAVLRLSDGVSWASMERASGVVRLRLARHYEDEELLHPMLSGTFAVTNWWHGRDAFHAGAVVVGDGAWGVIGRKGQGKSSTLAYLAQQGFPVLSDDVLVEDAGIVRPGPAFIDLRPDAAARLGRGRDMGVLGARSRFRIDVPVVEEQVPLRGWILLEWGAPTRLRRVPVQHRIPLLLESRSVLLAPAVPARLLDHAALPCYALTRPRDWAVLPDVADIVAGLG